MYVCVCVCLAFAVNNAEKQILTKIQPTQIGFLDTISKK